MTFEDLDAWRKSRELMNGVYALTRQATLAGNFALCRQIQRAAVSVMSNVAEGFERQHIAEKLQAYNIARASCGEVRSLLCVVVDNYPLVGKQAERIKPFVEDAGRLLSGLISATRRRATYRKP